MTVSDLLTAARKAHDDYRKNVPHRKQGSGGKLVQVTGDTTVAEQAVRDALKFRQDADAADPDHTDLAWLEDKAAMRTSNGSLVDWYQTILDAGSIQKAEQITIKAQKDAASGNA